jgi:hypothetical protein
MKPISSSSALRRPRLARTARRIAAVMVSSVVVALPTAACQASSPHRAGRSSAGATRASAATGSTSSKLLAFSRCVRRHGVPNFPDPQAGATNTKFPSAQQLGVSESVLTAAEQKCAHLLPPGSDDQFPAAEVQVLLTGMLRFSKCMRQHGVPNWPDPSTNSDGQPFFQLSASGISRQEAHSQRITNAERKCQKLLPSALGGIPIG